MGCDCGKWLKGPDETGCAKRAELARKKMLEKRKTQKRFADWRFVTGCTSGYLPWVVLLHMSGGCSNSNVDTSKLKPLLFNKGDLVAVVSCPNLT